MLCLVMIVVKGSIDLNESNDEGVDCRASLNKNPGRNLEDL